MTSATQTTHLSKLDLFTPSPLHPLLLPLATGSYAVNGGTALMLSTPDVLARRDYIYSLLGDNVKDERYMRTRPAQWPVVEYRRRGNKGREETAEEYADLGGEEGVCGAGAGEGAEGYGYRCG
jgi:hypothetical protein